MRGTTISSDVYGTSVAAFQNARKDIDSLIIQSLQLEITMDTGIEIGYTILYRKTKNTQLRKHFNKRCHVEGRDFTSPLNTMFVFFVFGFFFKDVF